MNALLGITQDTGIVDTVANSMASADDVDGFLTGTTNPPILHPLRPFWDKINHPWNHHLATLFATHFIAKKPVYIDQETAIKDQFLKRLETLRKLLASYVPRTEGETSEEVSMRVAGRQQERLREKRRRTRQVEVGYSFDINDMFPDLGFFQLFDARIKICDAGVQGRQKEAWQALYTMLNTLGVDGNSSDETDDETHTVKIREWRSAEVMTLLRYIDENRKRTNGYGNPLPGARPRLRTRPRYPLTSRREAMACLPRNFYNDAWYDSLTEIEQVQLGVGEPVELPKVTDD